MAKKKSEAEVKIYCDHCEYYGDSKTCNKCTSVFNEDTQKYLAPTMYEHVKTVDITNAILRKDCPCVRCKYQYVHSGDDPCRECLEHAVISSLGVKDYINFIESDVVKPEPDNVNHPSHYADSTSIECIESMELTFGTEAVYHFAVCNAYKYLWRHKNKGKAEEDLNKANWYYHKAMRLLLEKDKEEVMVYFYEKRQLSTLKFYIDDYARRAGVQLKEVHFGGETV